MNINNIVKLYIIGTILFSFSIYLNIALSKFDINVLLFRLITPFGAILKNYLLDCTNSFSKKRLINFLKSYFFALTLYAYKLYFMMRENSYSKLSSIGILNSNIKFNLSSKQLSEISVKRSKLN